jgi:hypothetical protein
MYHIANLTQISHCKEEHLKIVDAVIFAFKTLIFTPFSITSLSPSFYS